MNLIQTHIHRILQALEVPQELYQHKYDFEMRNIAVKEIVRLKEENRKLKKQLKHAQQQQQSLF